MSWAPTADEAARAGASYDWLTAAGDGLYWVESSAEVGRAVVMGWERPRGTSAPPTRRVTTAGVGSGLHAYGGRPYAMLPSGGAAVVDTATGQVTVGTAATRTAHIYGDLAWSGGELLCVREDDGGDELVAIDPGTGVATVLRATDGFFASPESGAGRLAWTSWDRDVMPWDSSQIWVADHVPGGLVGVPVLVAGGPSESAVQPRWAADGSLFFLSDRSGWWNLYRWYGGRPEAVAPMPAECAAAPWESGYANYVLLPAGRIGMTVQHGPEHRLVVVEPDGTTRILSLPYTSVKPYLAAVGDRIALIGASPTRPQEVALVATDGSDRLEVVRRGPLDGHAEVSVPQVLRVASAGVEVIVLFYPPTTGHGPAPLIVRPHSGPTHHSDLRLDWEVQFFTSRGFAVADVDYRGSTGYGRQFRKALDGNWGRFDVADCRNVAEHLLATGRALPQAVFISGASAGGYTALRAACEDGPFTMAVARSAIVDPNRWKTTAPRFQQPHAAILTHDHAAVTSDQVQRPVLLIHGDRDDVAPVDDATTLAAALERRHLLVGMLRLDGVGHYLSPPAALAAALQAELDAYHAVLRQAGLPAPG